MRSLFVLLLPFIFSSALFAQTSVPEEVIAFKKEHDIPGVAVSVITGDKSTFYSFGVSTKQGTIPVSPMTIFAFSPVCKVLDKKKVTITLLDALDPAVPSILQQGYGEKAFNSHARFGNIGYAQENPLSGSYDRKLNDFLFVPLSMKKTFFRVPKEMQGQVATGYTKKQHARPNYFGLKSTNGGVLYTSCFDMRTFLQKVRKKQVNFENIELQLGWKKVSRDGKKIIDTKKCAGSTTCYVGFIAKSPHAIVIMTNRDNVPLRKLGRKLLLQASTSA